MKLSLTQMSELKDAILSLPEKEKDKLLVRLINKDQMLIKQLHFKLLENESDLEARFYELQNTITESFLYVKKQANRMSEHKKYDAVNNHARQLNGWVNEHASITKDKVSEFQLRLLILHLCFTNFPDFYQLYFPNKNADKHFDYLTGRLKAVLALYDKLHEDLQYDYKPQLLEVLEFVLNSSLSSNAEAKDLLLTPYFD
ncbi:hypothetical protein K5I29_01540 [Flavobacterium agricola]|uniref:Uncharacterized protein n=1 Tax=Flavobacterium agricola TaxID=2870839 RepID=A0ABY6M1P5_9FLAO|nr:hypothetical protein [Flavobacterium agricola]UYW01635.1 hypothetical protein K5I29_01540 [Flavobacterium agricola]